MSVNTFFRLRLHIFGRNDGVDELLGLQIVKDRSKYNILWTNTLSDLSFEYPDNASELRSFNCDLLLWQFLGWRYLLKKSSMRHARNTVLLFTDNEALFPLAVFFASLYKQNYLLGWWYGLISNWFRIERFMDARDTRWRYNYRNSVKVTIAFFLDVVTRPGLVFIEEFRRLSAATLCVGLTDTLDVLNPRFLHIFTSKAISHLYFYLTFWFKLVAAAPTDDASLEMGVGRARPEARVASAIYSRYVYQMRRKRLAALPNTIKVKSLPKKVSQILKGSVVGKVQNLGQQHSRRAFSTMRFNAYPAGTAYYRPRRRRKRPFVTRNLSPHSTMGGIRVPKVQRVYENLVKGKMRRMLVGWSWGKNAALKWHYRLVMQRLRVLLRADKRRLRVYVYKRLRWIRLKIRRFDFLRFIEKRVSFSSKGLKIRRHAGIKPNAGVAISHKVKLDMWRKAGLKAKHTRNKVRLKIRLKAVRVYRRRISRFNWRKPRFYTRRLRLIWAEWREYRRFRLLMRLDVFKKAYRLWRGLSLSRVSWRVLRKMFRLGSKRVLRGRRFVFCKSLTRIGGWRRFDDLLYNNFVKQRRCVIFTRAALFRLCNRISAVGLIPPKRIKKELIRSVCKNKTAAFLPLIYLNMFLVCDRQLFFRTFNRFELASNELLNASDADGSVKNVAAGAKSVAGKRRLLARQEFLKELRFYHNRLRFKRRVGWKRFLARSILLRYARTKRFVSKALRVVNCSQVAFWDQFGPTLYKPLLRHSRVLCRLRAVVGFICGSFINAYVRCYYKWRGLRSLLKEQLRQVSSIHSLKFKRLRLQHLVRYFKDLRILGVKLNNLWCRCKHADRFMRSFSKRSKLLKGVVNRRRKALNTLLRSRAKSGFITELFVAKNALCKVWRHRLHLFLTAMRVLRKLARIKFKAHLRVKKRKSGRFLYKKKRVSSCSLVQPKVLTKTSPVLCLGLKPLRKI